MLAAHDYSAASTSDGLELKPIRQGSYAYRYGEMKDSMAETQDRLHSDNEDSPSGSTHKVRRMTPESPEMPPPIPVNTRCWPTQAR
jgi:hypothetical protein